MIQRAFQILSVSQLGLLCLIGTVVASLLAFGPNRVQLGNATSELERLNTRFSPSATNELQNEVDVLINNGFISERAVAEITGGGSSQDSTDASKIPDIPQILVIEEATAGEPAYLRARVPGETNVQVLRVGDEINGWVVEQIAPASIAFRRGDSLVTVNPFATNES